MQERSMLRQSHPHHNRYIFVILLCINVYTYISSVEEDVDLITETDYKSMQTTRPQEETIRSFTPSIIDDIIVHGARHVSPQTIISKTPFHIGEKFRSTKTNTILHTLYSLGLFKNIAIYKETTAPGHCIVHIYIEEKDKVEEFIFEGNSHLTKDEIDKKLHYTDMKTIDEHTVAHLIKKLKKLYREKSYHETTITADLEKTGENRVKVIIKIDEGQASLVKRVLFEGNYHISAKKLTPLLYTREDWLFGFLYKAGTYHPDALEYDKHLIENFYQSNGYLAARVTETRVTPNPEIGGLDITFVIDEGDIYKFGTVDTDETSVLTKQQILSLVPFQTGSLYSKEKIQKTLETLRTTWGNQGYLFADVQPAVRPHKDTKTVDVNFIHDLGNQVKLRRLTISGNKKTRSGVIYRNLLFSEDALITTQQLDNSKAHIERLGYFDQRNGVNWKITPVDDEYADIELLLKEVPTGKFLAQAGFGGADIQSPSKGFRLVFSLADTNFAGTGIAYNFSGSYANDDRSIAINITNPWLFDRPLLGAIDIEHRKTTYDDLITLRPFPTEYLTSGFGSLGVLIPQFNFARLTAMAGAERILFDPRPRASLSSKDSDFALIYQEILDRRFVSGNAVNVNLYLDQDMRNHPVFTSRGYVWNLGVQTALPLMDKVFGYVKVEGDAHWYTPLINEYDLILHLHGHFGFIEALNGKQIPYRELYHIGGPATVRGFLFGQISPSIFGDSVGGTKAFWVNAEVIFPVTLDFSIRGLFFYDGGSGWDTPNSYNIDNRILRNNKFDYRHAVGFGVRLTYPTPMRIDWGFKLDRKKKRLESPYEVHFTMSHDF